MKALFTEESDIIEELRDMESEESSNREDRARIIEFYHGDSPVNPDDLQAMGLKYNVNWLSGHQVMSDAVEQIQSVHTKPVVTYRYTLKNAPEQFKVEWEQKFSRKLNEVLKDSGRYLKQALDVSAESVFFGTGLPYWKDKKCPFFESLPLSKHLVPRGAPQDILQIGYDAYITTMSIADMMHYINVTENDSKSGWDKSALKKLIMLIYNHSLKEPSVSVNWDNPEDYAKMKASGSEVDRFARTEIEVYHFHQVRYDLVGHPIERRILLKDDVENYIQEGERGVNTLDIPTQIYFNDHAFNSQSSRISPVHLATNLSADPKWHQILGLGYLNFEIDTQIEMLLNRINEHIDESMRNLWVASDSADAEELETFLFRHNGVVPEGLQLLQNRIQPQIEGAFDVVHYFTQQRALNGRGDYSNQGGTADKLEVQFQAEQMATADRFSNRISRHNLYWARVGHEIATRFVNREMVNEDDGYSECQELIEYMDREGIDLDYFNPDNIRCVITRLPGDGNSTRQGRIYMHYQENIDRYDPEVKPEILREMHYIATGDYEQAERLIKHGETRDQTQVYIALTENNIMRVQGISPPLDQSHIDTEHLPIHLKDMETILAEVSESGTNKIATENTFTIIGSHAMQHIKRLQQFGQTDAANQFQQVLQQLAQVWDRVANVTPTEQEQPGPEQQQQQREDNIKERKIQVDEKRLELDREREVATNMKYMRTQEHREEQAAQQLALQEKQLQQANKDSEKVIDEQR